MEDIYSAIIGEPVSDREKLAMIAQKLRKQQQIGQLGMITGDRVLAPMGEGMVKQSGLQAESLGKRGEQARYRKYQEGASARMDEREREQLAWQKQNAGLERALRRELEGARNATVLEAARIRESDNKKSDYKTMTVPQVMKLTEVNEKHKNLTKVVDGFKDEYAGSKITGVRGAKNFLASKAPIFTSEESEKAAKWWADYNLIYTLGERNKLFGATLTDNEQEEWRKNAISTDMTPEQIKEKLTWLRDKWGSEIDATRRGLKASQFDPSLVDEIFPADEEVVELDP